MSLIGFMGKKGSGKDTSADYLVKKYGYKKISFATPLKDAIQILFGFSDEQLYGDKKETIDDRWGTSPRKVMQYLGTDIFRNDINKIMPNIKNNFWTNIMEINYKNELLKNKNAKFVIADVRFKNEVDVIHKLGGKIIKIDRNTKHNDNHISENMMDKINDFDHIIDNTSSLNNLYKKIDLIIG